MGSAAVTIHEGDHARNKAERVNLRVTAMEKSLLVRAAQASHTSTTQFILRTALHSAEDVLAEETRFVLAPEQWSEFTALLERPARPIPALAQAASKPSPFRER